MRFRYLALLVFASASVLATGAVSAEAAGTIRGRVLGADGEPVPEAEVIARGSHGGRVLVRPVVQTDGKGRYLLERLPVGEWKIAIRAADHAPAVRSGLVMRDGVSLAGIDFTLDQGRTIEGRIVDAEGRPVPGEPIELRTLGFAIPGVALARAETDGAGRFRFPHLADLPCALTMGSDRVAHYRQEIGPHESPLTLRVEVLGHVAGRVVLEGGKGAPASFTVCVMPTGSTTPYPSWIAPSPYRTVKDAKNGRFLARGFKPGLYDVIVTAEGGISNRVNRVRLAPGKTVAVASLVLRPTGRVEGRVVGGSGNPVKNAKVALLHPDGRPAAGWATTADTQGTGIFQLWGLPEGKYVLHAAASGRSASVAVEIVAGERRKLDVTVR